MNYGFKIKTTNLHKIQQFLDKFKEEVSPDLQAVANKTLAEMAVFIHDYNQINNKEEASALTTARMNILTRQETIRKTFRPDPQVDFSVSVLLYPITKTTSVGFLYCSREEIANKFFKALKDLNITKCDDEKKLNKDLSKVSGSSGYTCQILDSIFPTGKDLEKNFPSFEERCEHAALDGCFQKYASGLKKGTIVSNETVDSFKNWLQTDEGKTSFTAALDFCRNNLVKDLTEDML